MQRPMFPSIKQPIVKDRNGFFTIVHGKETIRNSIVNILFTRMGERVHLPEFGSRLHELLFEQEDSIFDLLARQYVFDALGRWEQRIEVLAAIVSFSGNTATLTLQYRIKKPIPQESSLVLSFERDRSIIRIV